MLTNPDFLVQCVRIEPRQGDVIRIAMSYPVNLKMTNGEIYQGGIYSQPTAINSNINGSPTVIDIGSVYDADTITRDEIQSGYWEGAKVFSFYTQWDNPIENEMPDREYTMGKVRDQDERYTMELMGKADYLNQSNGRVVTADCENVFGDEHVDGTIIASDKSSCKKIVSNTDAAITILISQTEFVASVLAGFPDDYFGDGELMFITGANAGLMFKYVMSSLNDGTIKIVEPFYYPVALGDIFRIRQGCRKRFATDCVEKHFNGVNFRGFPHKPQKSSVIKFGDQ